VAGLVGAGLVGGIEMATGVLLGAGVAALIRRKGAPSAEPSAEPPAATRGRMRRLLDRAPHDLHELKERARAVMLAARGDLGLPPEAQRARPADSESAAAHERSV
jgi:hypothetical protein